MPVLSPCEDIKSLIERHAGIRVVSSAFVHGVKEYHSNCPWCGGIDRFITRPDDGWYTCAIRASGCGRHGDMLDFLSEYAGMSMREACEEIELDPDEVDFVLDERVEERALARVQPPGKQWQEHGRTWIHLCHTRQTLDYQLRDESCTAREKLHARGFSDEVIEQFQLQYVPLSPTGRWIEEEPEAWGLSASDFQDGKLKVPEGILIPWMAEGQLWKLEIRRLTDVKPDAKYGFIRGGQDNMLFNLDAIVPGKPVVLCESAMCAISGTQAAGDLATFVATGGASKTPEERFLEILHQASCVLVAFDDDEPDSEGKRAGDEGAAYWIGQLPNAIRWIPDGHDINEMLKGGQDIRKWVQRGFKSYELLAKARALPVPAAAPTPSLASSALGDPVEAWLSEMQQPPTSLQVLSPPEQEDRTPRPGTDTMPPRLFQPCRRCGHIDEWMHIPVGTDGRKIWVCACYDWWYEHPEWRPVSDAIALDVAITDTLPEAQQQQQRRSWDDARADVFAEKHQAELQVQRACPHIVMDPLSHKGSPCKGIPGASGWCIEHQKSHDLLRLGEALGYPEVEVNTYRRIGSGPGNWQAYAECAPEKWILTDMKVIRLKFGYHLSGATDGFGDVAEQGNGGIGEQEQTLRIS